MPVMLDDVVVPLHKQMLEALAGLVVKAEAYCRDKGLEETAITRARLTDDQWPFAKQVFECGHHSARAIAGIRAGVFEPELGEVPDDFASLHAEVAGSLALVSAMEPGELDVIADREMLFRFGRSGMTFTVETFLTSFSLPNFLFHHATAYDILRQQGLPLGKQDYLGPIRKN